MGILLMFNNTDTITVEDVKIVTQLRDADLTRTLMSLVEAELVTMFPVDDKNIASNHTFSLNYNYSNKRLKVKITASLQQETPQQTQQTYKHIEEDRKLYLQALIVRVMKARKILLHTPLINEVIGQASTRFQPNVQLIKKCIEHLIEKQYIERVDGERDKYSYIA